MRKAIAALMALVTIFVFAGCAKKGENIFGKKCSADEALKLAKGSDTVVFEDLKCTSGKKVWDSFYKKVSSGKPASVVTAFYYTLDKDHVSEELYEQEKNDYPVMFFYLVEYDGTGFKVTVRDSSKEEPEKTDTFKYLLHLTGKAREGADYSAYDRYVLADEQNITYEDIMAGLVSSRSDAAYHTCFVYSDLK
ncbi:MAG: hypothetical protein J5777_05125 [Clostridiales bacterium]|nr:hypothetical protein [Clostridiales bacterium]